MRNISILFLALIMVLSAGCASTTATATVSVSPDTSATDYPPTSNEPLVATGYPAPGYPAPGGAPALEARANVKVELIEQANDGTNPAQVILRVKLVSASPAEGSPDRFTPLIGQQIELHANKEGLPTLSVGDSFTADVTFRGDETNGLYLAENIRK